MSILKVARMGHPILRARARALDPAEILSDGVQRLIDDMIGTMHEYHGIGLAAPQVHEGVRLFVAGAAGGGPLPPVVVINPEVTIVGGEVEEDWEGCLSIPEIRGLVPRPSRIRLKALDRRAGSLELSATGFAARVLQHETDHLDGVLFLDRMRSLETLTFIEEYARYQAGIEDGVRTGD